MADMGETAASLNRRPITWSVADERKAKYLCDLFEIVRTTEALESAYNNGMTTGDEYTKACNSLLSQFQNASQALQRSGGIRSVEEFMEQYRLECPLARTRLIHDGVPATVLHTSATASSNNDKSNISKATANFITLQDQLALDDRSVSSLAATLTELCIALNKLSVEYEGKSSMADWLKRLNTTMHATDSIDDRDKAQLLSDVEKSYSGFSGAL